MGDAIWQNKAVGMHYKSIKTNRELFIAINMETYEKKSFSHLPAGTKPWKKLLDTQSYYDKDEYFQENPSANRKTSQNVFNNGEGEPLPDSTYTLEPRTIVVLAR